VVALRQQSEGCEFDPRGGLVHDLFAVSASLATSPVPRMVSRDIKRRIMRIRILTVYCNGTNARETHALTSRRPQSMRTLIRLSMKRRKLLDNIFCVFAPAS
jgi:hypothetical protein